jgi:hypothetical protein
VLWLRRVPRSTSACRVLGSFNIVVLYVVSRLGQPFMVAPSATSPSSSAKPVLPRVGLLDLARAAASASRTMSRFTAPTCGAQQVSPCVVGTHLAGVRGLHLGFRTSSWAASSATLRAGTAGPPPSAPAAWPCSGCVRLPASSPTRASSSTCTSVALARASSPTLLTKEGGTGGTKERPGCKEGAAMKVRRGRRRAVGVADLVLATRFAATSTAQPGCQGQRGEVGVAELL